MSSRAPPGGSSALRTRWTRRSELVTVPSASHHAALAGRTTSASSAVLVRKMSWTTRWSRPSRSEMAWLDVGLGLGRVLAQHVQRPQLALAHGLEHLGEVPAVGRRDRAAPGGVETAPHLRVEDVGEAGQPRPSWDRSRTRRGRGVRSLDARDGCCAIPRRTSGVLPTNCSWSRRASGTGAPPTCALRSSRATSHGVRPWCGRRFPIARREARHTPAARDRRSRWMSSATSRARRGRDRGRDRACTVPAPTHRGAVHRRSRSSPCAPTTCLRAVCAGRLRDPISGGGCDVSPPRRSVPPRAPAFRTT